MNDQQIFKSVALVWNVTAASLLLYRPHAHCHAHCWVYAYLSTSTWLFKTDLKASSSRCASYTNDQQIFKSVVFVRNVTFLFFCCFIDLTRTAVPTVDCTRAFLRVKGNLKRIFCRLRRENDKRKHGARNHRNLAQHYCRKQEFVNFQKLLR